MNLRIADYFGIPLYFNILTIPFALLIYGSREDLGTLSVSVYIFTLFFVLLHEYGHCFIARRFGWPIHDITILPIGGIAKITFRHYDPKEEIKVALAGPAVSLSLFCIFFPICILQAYLENFGCFLIFLVMSTSNFVIFAFNLLPIYPMDGGRVLRACLSCMVGHARGTWWAVRIGQVGGLILSIAAIYNEYYVAGVIFILMGVIGQNELAYAKLISILHKIRQEICESLNKPELKRADLPELIDAIEAIENEELKVKLKLHEVIPLLKDLRESKVSI